MVMKFYFGRKPIYQLSVKTEKTPLLCSSASLFQHIHATNYQIFPDAVT